jgi:exodeoxyribonuclease-3
MHAGMLKLTTWNVNGIRAREAEVAEWIAREQPDVVCLQEIKASPEKVPASLCELPGYHGYWHGHKGYSGVALLLSKRRFADAPRFEHPEFDHETRIVTAQADGFVFAAVYVPNGGKDFEAKMRFLAGLEMFAARIEREGHELVLCGDLNVAREERDVHPMLRRPNLIGCSPEEREQFERIVNCGLIDLARQFYPDDDNLFTWWAPWRKMRERNIGWRIDYILASRALAARATQCEVHREFGKSDHGPLLASFEERTHGTESAS